MTEESSFM